VINLKTAKQIGLTMPPNVLGVGRQGNQMNFGFSILDFGLGRRRKKTIWIASLSGLNRKFVLLFGAMLFALCDPVEAQQRKIPLIGFLSLQTASSTATRFEVFRQALRELGYFEGKTIAIEWRYADGKLDRASDLAAELVRLKVDVIVTAGQQATRAAKEVTTTIPIVMARDRDPVGLGFVANLARPGGNITGLSQMSPELSGKKLELLKEIVPKLTRVAVIWNPANPGTATDFKETEAAAQSLRVDLQVLEVNAPLDIERAFQAAAKGRAGALMVLGDPVIFRNRKRVVELAAKDKLPGAYPPQFADVGGLLVYGTNENDFYRRAATYVAKILKGAKPADLPVEQPTKFELIINLKAAQQIGLKIPPNVLARADKVIR
jgi:putative ABC transport system substrate-binding protein